MTNEIQICFSKWWENEKQNTKFKTICQSQAKTKNKKQNSNLRKRKTKFISFFQNDAKTKFISVFQSDAKTKKEIRSSKPFFKVKRKRKTKSKIQTCFSMSCENEKCWWHLNSIFSCHRKTVGTKVHVFNPSPVLPVFLSRAPRRRETLEEEVGSNISFNISFSLHLSP